MSHHISSFSELGWRESGLQMDSERKQKVAIGGASGAGKTSLVNRLIRDTFQESVEATVGVAYHQYVVHVGEEAVNLSIWDTAGQERYQALAPIFVRESKAVVFLVDLSQKVSVDEHWGAFERFASVVPEGCVLVVCGSKIDLVEDLQDKRLAELSEWAKNATGQSIFLTSAKTGQGVAEMFQWIAEEIVRREHACAENREREVQDLQGHPGGCC